jgi:hypothetical protein
MKLKILSTFAAAKTALSNLLGKHKIIEDKADWPIAILTRTKLPISNSECELEQFLRETERLDELTVEATNDASSEIAAYVTKYHYRCFQLVGQEYVDPFDHYNYDDQLTTQPSLSNDRPYRLLRHDSHGLSRSEYVRVGKGDSRTTIELARSQAIVAVFDRVSDDRPALVESYGMNTANDRPPQRTTIRSPEPSFADDGFYHRYRRIIRLRRNNSEHIQTRFIADQLALATRDFVKHPPSPRLQYHLLAQQRLGLKPILPLPFNEEYVLSNQRIAEAALEAINYEWATREQFAVLQELVGLYHGTNPDELRRSTMQVGPVYNRIDPVTRFPLPGTLQHPTNARDLDSQMPDNGHGAFRGLWATTDGQIHFSFDSPVGGIVYLLPDDISLALVLAFAEDEPLFPSLSLEAAEQTHFTVNQKVWDPPWIAETRFGKTLYATDTYIGAICVYHRGVDLSRVSQAARLAAREIFDRMDAVGGNCALQMQVHNVDFAWEADPNGGTRCAVLKAKVGIKSESPAYDNEGRRKRWQGTPTQHAQIFNDSIDTITGLWPVFERYKQFSSLLYALVELRRRGFQPNTELNKHIFSAANGLQSRPNLPISRRLAMWHYD